MGAGAGKKERLVKAWVRAPARGTGEIIPIFSHQSSGAADSECLDDLLQEYRPTIDDIKEYSHSYVEGKEDEPAFKPLVGEEANLIGQVLCLAAGLHYMVSGRSGSGKTALVDKVLGLIPAGMVYKIGLASDLALYRDTENLNRARILYVTELQKAYQRRNSPLVEILKDITEGKPAERRRLDSRGEVLKDIITAGKMAVMTCASENKYMEQEDIELKRRLFHFHTDESPEQIERINTFYTLLRSPDHLAPRCSSRKYKLLSTHLQEAMHRQFIFTDPFFTSIGKIIPPVPKSPSYAAYYYALVNASAKFHFRERLIEGEKMHISLHDHYLAYSLYYSSLLETLRELNPGLRDQKLIEKAAAPPEWGLWWREGCRVMQRTVSSPESYSRWKALHYNSEDGIREDTIRLIHPKTGEVQVIHHENKG